MRFAQKVAWVNNSSSNNNNNNNNNQSCVILALYTGKATLCLCCTESDLTFRLHVVVPVHGLTLNDL